MFGGGMVGDGSGRRADYPVTGMALADLARALARAPGRAVR
jgi:hypothetical protein